jgi:AraC family transcriptional regulator of adaptative response / methylphosphotriester-DNA alkyltransferase methyltransferase
MQATTTHRDGTHARRQELLRDARIALLRDHGAHVRLDTVARRVATSRRQLQRVFNELSDRSFRDTLADIRMRHARQLLRETDMPIRHVASAAGCATPAQFSKAFRNYHGTTPGAYRRACRSEAAAR